MDNFYLDNPGSPTDRVDGREKVTGTAKYAAEHLLNGMVYAVVVGSNITKGRIKAMDTKAASAAPGVLAVITHQNAELPPGFQPPNKEKKEQGWDGLKVFSDDRVHTNGQPIAIVVADTYERARYAATLVKAQYEKEAHQTDFIKNMAKAKPLKSAWSPSEYKRGEAEAFRKAPVWVEEEYIVPTETHNPMEMHAVIVNWEAADKITVYTKTQGPKDSQRDLMKLYRLTEENVKVIAEFVGGGFGSALRTWPHEVAAIMAAKKVNRPLKLVLSRDQMFTMVGYRPFAWQKIGIGASADGILQGISHHAIGQTSSYEDFSEGIVNVSKFLYACPNVNTSYKLLPLDVATPIWMRGPGEATGTFALESALDELSYKLKIDPIELRIRNYAEIDPEKNLPWSSKFLKECYQLGMEKIGWKSRPGTPRTMMEDGMLVGYGMSTGVFFALRWSAAARGRLREDGILVLQSAVSDMGPGTATAMVTIASENLGIPPENIIFELGSSALPPGPTQGGSATTSSLGSAVYEVCTDLKQKLIALALKQETVFHTATIHASKPEDLVYENGRVMLAGDRSVGMDYKDLLKTSPTKELESTKESGGGPELRKYSMYSFSVHFTKLHVHPVTGIVKIKNIVTVGDAGKIINEKAARSQMIGGVVGGIGMALMEEAMIDHRYGRYVNNNFADYHVPVNADVPQIEAIFVNKPDPIINPMGAKGMGEIALIGYAASVANAVFNATGKRVRELPITVDRIIG